MRRRSHSWRLAGFVGLYAALLAGAASASDTGNGSKNFRTPATVPNYFSNEAGPMLGPASETQRGPLYMGQTYGTPRPQQTATVAAPVPAPPPERQHVAMAEPRGRLIRGHGGRVVAHHVTVHGRAVVRIVARGSAARPHSSTHAASTRAVSHTTRTSSSHRHARG